MAEKTVLILGGGMGGISAACELRRLLPPKNKIALIEKEAQHAFAPSFLWLMSSDRAPGNIVRDVHRMVPRGVDVMIDHVESIDLTSHSVRTSSRSMSYDFLIVSLGAELWPEMIPGLSEAAYTFYTFDGAIRAQGGAA